MSEPTNFDGVTYSAQGTLIDNNSPVYSQAVNDSRFVKGFGVTALVYALLSVLGFTLLGGGVGVGIGLFIARYDTAKYYRILGIVVIIFAILGYVIPFLGTGVLSGAIMGKGIQVMGVLSKVEKKDEEWQTSKKRALIGTIASGAGLGISAILMVLFLIGSIFMFLRSK
jgi:predicted small integral membrane protein